MKQCRSRSHRRIMLDDGGRNQRCTMLAFLCGVLTCTQAAVADESDTDDLMFLEYLGSWGESDEDWLLFTEEDDDQDSEADDVVSLPEAERPVEVKDEI